MPISLRTHDAQRSGREGGMGADCSCQGTTGVGPTHAWGQKNACALAAHLLEMANLCSSHLEHQLLGKNPFSLTQWALC